MAVDQLEAVRCLSGQNGVGPPNVGENATNTRYVEVRGAVANSSATGEGRMLGPEEVL